MVDAARLTAIGFATGGAIHAIGFMLIWLGVHLYGPGYPAWRHAAMAAVDASIAWVAVRRRQWLFVALPAWVAEQWLANGFGFFCVIVLVAIGALMWEQRRPH